MQGVKPCLWFNDQAEEAVAFYQAVFKDVEIVAETRRVDETSAAMSGLPRGGVLTIAFRIAGRNFVALNGGPHFTFSPAVSLVVDCETQDEVDYFWEKLSEGGETQQCGWLQDKFGVSWQVVPVALPEMLAGPDPARTQRVMAAMLQMTKLDIAALERAYRGK